jgi:hypothetical protein
MPASFTSKLSNWRAKNNNNKFSVELAGKKMLFLPAR